jgi:uncharacterized membrane protein YhhN
MVWPFIAILCSAWLYINANNAGKTWQRWIFKPATLLLLILFAWQAPQPQTSHYLVMLGLVATLVTDTLLLLPKERLLYALAGAFACHLFYTLSFARETSFTLFWPLPLGLMVIGCLMLAVIWHRLEEMRWSVFTCLLMTLIMVWVAGEQYQGRGTDLAFSLLSGSLLLLLANLLWLFSRYRCNFRQADAIIAAFYFAGHFLVVRALYI